MTSSDPKKPVDHESFKDKVTEKLEKLKKDERVEGIYSFAKSNTKDTIAYILLVLGLILMFFEPAYGTFLIGLIAGLYFSEELIFIVTHFNELVEEQGLVRVLILGVLAIALFFAAPFLFFGAAIGALITKVAASSK